MSKDKFEVNIAKEIESLVRDGSDIIDAVCYWCEVNGVDIETAASLIKKDQVLKSKIRFQAEELNIIEKSARLPI